MASRIDSMKRPLQIVGLFLGFLEAVLTAGLIPAKNLQPNMQWLLLLTIVVIAGLFTVTSIIILLYLTFWNPYLLFNPSDYAAGAQPLLFKPLQPGPAKTRTNAGAVFDHHYLLFMPGNSRELPSFFDAMRDHIRGGFFSPHGALIFDSDLPSHVWKNFLDEHCLEGEMAFLYEDEEPIRVNPPSEMEN